MNISDIMIRLRDIVVVAFEEDDFIEVLFPDIEDYDYASEAAGDKYNSRALHAVRGYYRRAEAPGVLKLAKMCQAKRAERADLKTLIVDLEVLVTPAAGAGGTAAGPAAANAAPVMPEELLTSVSVAENSKVDFHALADEVRPAIHKASVDSAIVADAFHLSPSPYRRLAAVLALEHGPNVRYVQWLTERIIVESPIAAMYAAQALTVFALKSPRTDASLNSTKRFLKQASHQLDNLLEDEEDPQLLAPRRPVDIATRKRQVLAALSILDLRMRRNPPPKHLNADEFDQLATVLINCLTVDELNQVLKEGIGMPLNRLVPDTDTLEQIVCRVLVAACEYGWEGALAFSVTQAHADRPACKLPFAARFANPIV